MLESVTTSINNAVNKFTDPQGGLTVKITIEEDVYIKLGLLVVGTFVLCAGIYFIFKKIMQ